MRLTQYVLRRILQLAPVVLVVVIVNFVLMHAAPGDVTHILVGENPDPEYQALMRQRFGLDRPVHEQLLVYLGRVFRGDLGDSYLMRRPVIQIIAERAGPTVILAGTSLLIAGVIGTLLGTLVSIRAGTTVDVAVSVVAVTSYSLPIFWLGLMLILAFSIYLSWFPATGMMTSMGPEGYWGQLLDRLHHLTLPVATLVIGGFGQYLRVARTSVLQVLNEDFITTARAIGFNRTAILVRHALRNASLPIVSMLGLQLGVALTGAVLTETVFAWPGLGRLVYEAILGRDTPLIMGAYIVMSILVALASLLTDLVYAILDPRVEYR